MLVRSDDCRSTINRGYVKDGDSAGDVCVDGSYGEFGSYTVGIDVW